MVPRVDLDLFVHINRMNSAIFFWRFCIFAAISSRQQHRYNRQPMLFASAMGPLSADASPVSIVPTWLGAWMASKLAWRGLSCRAGSARE